MLDRSGTGSPLPDRKRCSGAVQANFFLDFVNPGPDTLVVLGYRTDPGRHATGRAQRRASRLVRGTSSTATSMV
jgi:coenzyme F420-reducing hydrogenase delta subunit